MRPLPPGWPDHIPGLPLLLVFVGPGCFEHARRERKNGFFNHVTLNNATEHWRYQWPTNNLMVIVILLNNCGIEVEAALLAALLADQPAELIVRYWPTDVVQTVMQ